MEDYVYVIGRSRAEEHLYRRQVSGFRKKSLSHSEISKYADKRTTMLRLVNLNEG
jgi:hypothetical protein